MLIWDDLICVIYNNVILYGSWPSVFKRIEVLATQTRVGEALNGC